MKNVPGRRTDWHECQWLQYFHTVGLLRPAFRPEADICRVRTLMRHRAELVAMASQHVLHMQKALTQMNLQIHHVISDITGTNGLAIVDAILAGQRDPVVLATLRDCRVKASQDTIQRSLVGTWRAEHVFTLKQSSELYRAYQQQIVECDREIEAVLRSFEPRVDPLEKPLPLDRKRNRNARKRRKKLGPSETPFDLRRPTSSLGWTSPRFPGSRRWRSLYSAKSAAISQSGLQPRISRPGWRSVPTTTSAAAVSYGRACGR